MGDIVILMLVVSVLSSCNNHDRSTGSPIVNLPANGEMVTNRVVTLIWPEVPGALSYQINVRSNGNIGEDGGYLWATTTDNRYDVDMGFCDNSLIGNLFYWSVRPQLSGGHYDDWALTRNFFYNPPIATLPAESKPMPPPPIPPEDIALRLLIEPVKPLADGKSLVSVKAEVRDKSGKPVANAKVWFFVDGYFLLEGKVLGADEKLQVGNSYLGEPSGGYVLSDGVLCNNAEALTSDNGEASAIYRVPSWKSYMDSKPVRLGVEYGGSNLNASRLVYFAMP